MILHIPHSSREIPERLRGQFVLDDEELSAELDLMTDAFTDELFAPCEATVVRFPVSRLAVDVERFADDTQEPMSKVGMGMIYTRTAAGVPLRRALSTDEVGDLKRLYETHHQALLCAVEYELTATGAALIVDCHSFPSRPLLCDQDQALPRPDFCIGTDPFHTPEAPTRSVASALERLGYRVELDHPYAGTLVPAAFWKRDARVKSIMIEVNRSLYMDEDTGEKTSGFEVVGEHLRGVLSALKSVRPAC